MTPYLHHSSTQNSCDHNQAYAKDYQQFWGMDKGQGKGVKVLSCVPSTQSMTCDHTYGHEPPHPHSHIIYIPGSKSLTIRSLLLAAIAEGESLIKGVLKSEDTYWCIRALESLGVQYKWLDNHTLQIRGKSGYFASNHDFLHHKLYLGASGITTRFLLALLWAYKPTEFTHPTSITLCGHKSLESRPIAELCDYLRLLSKNDPSRLVFCKKDNHLPLIIQTHGCQGGQLNIIPTAEASSQFISALLMAAPLAQEPVNIHYGAPLCGYISMTYHTMASFGVKVDIKSQTKGTLLSVHPQTYRSRCFTVELDISSACYIYAFAALHGLSVIVKGIKTTSLQPDVRFLNILKKLGCTITSTEEGILCSGPPHLKGGWSVDMSEMPDQIPTLACLALCSDGAIEIRGTEVLRYHECDRITAIEHNIGALGGKVESKAGMIKVFPQDQGPTLKRKNMVVLKSFGDHRICMSCVLLATHFHHIIVEQPSCVSKTFPQFFEVFQDLGCIFQVTDLS
ncbi:MAG: 3-phosphoshikimate 1-carboxyvinyltransferase [Proteobacteria bacterium]|nr:3-phosphoshikimate 1-carboxyvinyltransferase [Pseudomonadota bacterium]